MYNNEVEVFMSDFESIKEPGYELWRASNLMKLMGYTEWRRFGETIQRSMGNFDGIIIKLCEDNGINISYSSAPASNPSLFDINIHFIPTTRIQRVGPNGEGSRELPDFFLTRLACYAIAMEADNRKPEVKLAKQYLLLSVLENEKRKQYVENNMRLQARDTYSQVEKSLDRTLIDQNVPRSKIGIVKNAGDQGFFNNPGGTRTVKEELMIQNNQPLANFMPFETIVYKQMANIDTKYGILNNNIQGVDACAAEAYEQNKKQREHMYNNSGQFPEDTMPIERITSTKKENESLTISAVNATINIINTPDSSPFVYYEVEE